MEATSSSITSVTIYLSTQRHIQDVTPFTLNFNKNKHFTGNLENGWTMSGAEETIPKTIRIGKEVVEN